MQNLSIIISKNFIQGNDKEYLFTTDVVFKETEFSQKKTVISFVHHITFFHLMLDHVSVHLEFSSEVFPVYCGQSICSDFECLCATVPSLLTNRYYGLKPLQRTCHQCLEDVSAHLCFDSFTHQISFSFIEIFNAPCQCLLVPRVICVHHSCGSRIVIEVLTHTVCVGLFHTVE